MLKIYLSPLSFVKVETILETIERQHLDCFKVNTFLKAIL